MKKILVFAFAMMISLANVVYAQTKEEMQASQQRIEKLQKLVDKMSASTGTASVDTYITAVNNAAKASIDNSGKLENLYYRSIGETKDGVTEVTIKKPTLDECMALSASIADEGIAIKKATDAAQAATEGVKSIKNPMKAGKAAKAVALSTDAMSILGEESLAQGKAIANIIETVKSAKNL